MGMDVPASTLEGVETPVVGRRASWARRTFLGLLTMVVAAGAVGLLGLHTSTATAAANGYDLTLRYPWSARAGLDTTWQVRVHHVGGFPGPLMLTVSGDYFDIFETQGFHPDADKSTRDGEVLYLTFDPPPGDTFVVDFDAYIQPSSQRGRTAAVALVDGDRTLVRVPFRTWLLP
jgi:hypothetical protein